MVRSSTQVHLWAAVSRNRVKKDCANLRFSDRKMKIIQYTITVPSLNIPTFQDFQLGAPETLAVPISLPHLEESKRLQHNRRPDSIQHMSLRAGGRKRRFLWPGLLESVNLDQRFLLTAPTSAPPGLRANRAALSEPRLWGMKARYWQNFPADFHPHL